MKRHNLPLRCCWVLLCAGLVLVSGCSNGTGESALDTGQLTAAVSIPPQAFLVERIGGEHIRVVTVMGPGANPHSYLPTDREISEVMRARVYFRIGVPFENGKWFETVKRSRRLNIVDMREGLTLREMASHAGTHGNTVGKAGHVHSAACDHGGLDPHVWLAPGLLRRQATTVLVTLQEIAPDRAADFQKNFDKLTGELDALDTEIRAILEPFRGADLYVYHPSWGYFCDAYGLRQHAVEVEGKEPSDAELTRIQDQARKAQAKVLFVQPQIEGRSAKALAKLLGAEVRVLDPLAYDVIASLRNAAKAIAEAGR